MDLFVMDPSTWNATEMIDTYDSLIWTERYNDAGEVTLVVPSTQDNRNQLKEGIFLWTPESQEVALVDTVSDKDGEMTLSGEHLAGFLKQRILRNTWSTAKDNWKITGDAGTIANTIIQNMLTGGGLITTSVLPGSYGDYETLPGLVILASPGGDSMTVAVPYGTVFDGVKQVCDLDDLGFSLHPQSIAGSSNTINFQTYRGRDLTSGQSVYPVVAFDPALDSLADVESLRSIAGYATAAYAFASGMTGQSQVGSAFANGTDTLTGWQRRSIMVDASDVTASDYTAAELTSVLNKKAKNALVNNNYVKMNDGQVVPQNAFTYGVDYKLGDIVELRGSTVVADKARITEYIRAQDSTGYRAYPTLSVI